MHRVGLLFDGVFDTKRKNLAIPATGIAVSDMLIYIGQDAAAINDRMRTFELIKNRAEEARHLIGVANVKFTL